VRFIAQIHQAMQKIVAIRMITDKKFLHGNIFTEARKRHLVFPCARSTIVALYTPVVQLTSRVSEASLLYNESAQYSEP
jgi:hypothetical protein